MRRRVALFSLILGAIAALALCLWPVAWPIEARNHPMPVERWQRGGGTDARWRVINRALWTDGCVSTRVHTRGIMANWGGSRDRLADTLPPVMHDRIRAREPPAWLLNVMKAAGAHNTGARRVDRYIHAGWPLRCATYHVPMTWNLQVFVPLQNTVGGTTPPNAPMPSGYTRLPLSIEPLPLALNFASASVMLLPVVMVFAFAARSLHRRSLRRRGRCVGCGYDLRGLNGAPCPECGRSVQAPGECPATTHRVEAGE